VNINVEDEGCLDVTSAVKIPKAVPHTQTLNLSGI